MIIDPKSNTPIYQQIAEQMRDAIRAGVHRPGEALPSLRALAVEIRVNPNTVQRAYEELEREGVIESRRGLGVFVADRKSQAARGQAERRIAAMFQEGITAGFAADLPPPRLRELFESVLGTSLVKARRR